MPPSSSSRSRSRSRPKSKSKSDTYPGPLSDTPALYFPPTCSPSPSPSGSPHCSRPSSTVIQNSNGRNTPPLDSRCSSRNASSPNYADSPGSLPPLQSPPSPAFPIPRCGSSNSLMEECSTDDTTGSSSKSPQLPDTPSALQDTEKTKKSSKSGKRSASTKARARRSLDSAAAKLEVQPKMDPFATQPLPGTPGMRRQSAPQSNGYSLEETIPLAPVKTKLAQIRLLSKGWVEPWTQVKIKWRILEGVATDVFLGLYDVAQEDLSRYQSSVVCHDRVSSTSVMVAPLLPGYYTIRLIRDETTVLAFKTFQVISPLDKDLHGEPVAAGGWHNLGTQAVVDADPCDLDLVKSIQNHVAQMQLQAADDEKAAAAEDSVVSDDEDTAMSRQTASIEE